VTILLLDVMDTIVWDPYREIPAFFGLEFAEFWPLLNRQAWSDFERALIDEPTFLRTFFEDGRDYDHDGFLAMLAAGYRFLPGMEELLAELRSADVTMHALSNYPIWYERIEEKLALTRYLPWTFVSWTTGVRKPDPESWLGAARTLDVQPSDCLFVDDRESNCEGARATGMSALRFEGAESLKAELNKLDLLS
jgi:FMN hydrolase / 5-amino-6-(5-phospho-D-ribitylamino)uracil phosphatase